MANYTLLGAGGHYADGTVPYNAGHRYGNVGLGRCTMFGDHGFTDALYVRQIIRVAGTISYLSWGLDHAFGGTGGTALTLTLKTPSSSALAVSFGLGTTGWVTDSTHSVNVSIGDWLEFDTNIATGNSSYVGSFYCASARFLADTASAQMLATVGASVFGPSASDRFVNFLGILSAEGSTNEGDQQFKCLATGTPAAGTWRYMACYVESNNFDADTTITNRITDQNGTRDGNMVIPIQGGIHAQTGYFEDSSHSDSVNFGDLLGYRFHSTAATGSLKMDWIGAHFIATDAAECMIGGTPGPANTLVVGDTVYSPLFGGGTSYASPARSTGLFPYALSASKFTNHITAADSQAAATFTLLKNGSASGLAVSSEAGQTGYFMVSDIDSVDFAVGDTCANKIVVTGGTGEHVTWAGAALLLTAS